MTKKTVKEIAEMFGVTRAGVYVWLQNGLPYEVEKVIGIKPRKKIDPTDVEKFLRLGKREDKR